MSANGKLIFAFLDEDDPNRGYFRVRPMLELGGEKIVVTDTDEYGDDGFLRVIPDKNEITTFKNRMRTLGGMCFIDMREHPRENDKIRQNRNYQVGTDRNRFMIYSDVIRAPEDGEICEVVTSDDCLPRTPLVCVRRSGKLYGPTESGKTTGELPCIGDAQTVKVTDPEGAILELFVNIRKTEPKPVPVSAPAPAPTAAPAKQPEAQPVREERMPSGLHALEGQAGLNPRIKGRTVAELIDKDWFRYRTEELGTEVPPLAETTPALSPADKVAAALKEAWAFDGCHAPVLKAIGENAELMERLVEEYAPDKAAQPSDERMIELEAERLKLEADLDGLTKRTHEMKAQILREMEQQSEITSEQLRGSIVILEEEIAARRNALKELQAEAETFRGAFRAELERPVSQMLAEKFAASKIAELLPETPAPAVPVLPVQPPVAPMPAGEDKEETVLLSENALIDRMSLSLRAQGLQLRRNDILHILTVIALQRPLILAGFAGEDDRYMASSIGKALGRKICGCTRINPLMPHPHCGKEQGMILSVLDAPSGRPLRAGELDRGFLLMDVSESCLPGNLPEQLPVDEESFAALTKGTLSADAADKLTVFAGKLSEYGVRVPRGAFADCARYIAGASGRMNGGEHAALDYALAYRLLPSVLASASDKLLRSLPGLFAGYTECLRVMRAEFPLER